MTAPQPATPGSDSVRAQITEVLRMHAWSGEITGEPVRPGAPCTDCGMYPGAVHDLSLGCPRTIAKVLVPLVDRLRVEAKAEALEEAADEDSQPYGWGVRAVNVADLRDRAAAYRTSPSSEETHRG